MRVILLALSLWCSVDTAFGEEWALQFVSPDELWLQDSIPEKATERIVIAHHPKLEAHWVVALVNSPYEATRRQLHDVIHNAFGIDSEREITMTLNAETPVNPHMPKEPLFGDGFNEFRAIGVPITAAREYRIETKQYNTGVRWWKSASKSEWRLIDGRPLFGRAVSILVVSRTDHAREWAWMHPGIPMPFTVTGDTKLVTDTEVALIATVSEQVGRPQVHYFVPYTGYRTNGVLNVMMAIRDAANNLPEATRSP